MKASHTFYYCLLKSYKNIFLTLLSTMSSEKAQLVCKCGKTYKTQQPYIKHVQKCVNQSAKKEESEHVENIHIQINSQDVGDGDTENMDTEDMDTSSNQSDDAIEKPRLRRHLAPDAEYLAQVDNDMRNDLQEFMNSGGKLPAHEPLEGENVTVNTLVIETLLKTVLTQVLSHHHRHTQNVIEQNTKLIEENKMLVRMLRTIVYTKNNIQYEIDVQSNDSGDDNDENKEDTRNTESESEPESNDA